MANEIHRKLLVAETALDFDASFAEIDSLPAGDMCWSNNVIDCEDCEFVEIFAQIKMGATSPAGTVEFYGGRAGANLRMAEGYGNTLTDHGTEGTAADVTRMISCLGMPLKVVAADETADLVVVTRMEFWYPGADWQLFINNNTDEAFNGTSSPHAVYYRGWGLEVQ